MKARTKIDLFRNASLFDSKNGAFRIDFFFTNDFLVFNSKNFIFRNLFVKHGRWTVRMRNTSKLWFFFKINQFVLNGRAFWVSYNSSIIKAMPNFQRFPYLKKYVFQYRSITVRIILQVFCRIRPLNKSEERNEEKFLPVFPNDQSIKLAVSFNLII